MVNFRTKPKLKVDKIGPTRAHPFLVTQMTANTDITDMSEFWPGKKLTNTDIADFANISEIWATMGGICRHVAFL